MDIAATIRAFPDQVATGAALGAAHRVTNPQRRIIACGMGGSGAPGELLATLDPRVTVWNDFSLPSDASAQDLVTCTSWSGETAETISAYREARVRGIPVLVVTHADSTLGRAATEDGSPLVALPVDAIPPRFAVGYMVGALGVALGIDLAVAHLDAVALEAEGQRIAALIGTRVPTVYVTHSVVALGPTWKTLFNENAKVHADWNAFPELTHNELADFSPDDAPGYLPIILKNPAENADDLDTVARTIAFMEQVGYTVATVVLSGSTQTERVLNGYILGLWTSCALAERLGVDPLNTETIQAFKHVT